MVASGLTRAFFVMECKRVNARINVHRDSEKQERPLEVAPVEIVSLLLILVL